MSGRLFSEVSFTVSGLMEQVGCGLIALPDLQRPFVWPNTKVRDLFDSMYRGYPVGYFLFWENGAAKGTSVIGTDRKQLPPRLLVIDGQQRLTSLYAVLRGRKVKRQDFSEEMIQIAFRPTDGAFEVADAAIKKDPAWLSDISLLWNGQTDLFALVGDYLARLGATREVSPDERRAIQQAIMRLQQLDSFPFTALSLSSELDEEQVADVFVRINSKGTPLNQADFILTLMSVFRDRQRAELEDFCRRARVPPAGSAPSPFNYFLEPEPDHLLRVAVGLGFRRARLKHVYSILRGKDLETGDFSSERREEQFGVLDAAQSYTLDLQHWQDFLQCLVRAGYRNSAMVSSKNALLYTYVFYLIGRRDYRISLLKLRDAIARWFFFVSLTGRYTDSPETRMEQDLADLREVSGGDAFLRHLERAANLTHDYWAITLPGELATSSARSPGLFAYYAALHRLGARAFFSPMQVRELLDPALRGKRSALERHHLFPKAFLEKKGIESLRETNQIANYAVVEWADNAAIGEKAPHDYFPELEKRSAKRPEERRSMFFWHALPEGWERMDYPRFLEARRLLLARVIQAGFETLSPSAEVVEQGLAMEAALERACLLLPDRLAAELRERQAEPLRDFDILRAEVHRYLTRLESLAAEEPRFDLDLARRLGDRCLRLLARDGRPADQARLAQAAVSYFTTEEDLSPDLASGEGFRDDEALLSAVERALTPG